MQTSDS